MKRTPLDLKGRRVAFFRLSKTDSGCRTGLVRSVATDRRGNLKSVTVRMPGDRPGYRRRARVTLKELTMPNHPTGVMWRGRFVPYPDWLEAP